MRQVEIMPIGSGASQKVVQLLPRSRLRYNFVSITAQEMSSGEKATWKVLS